MKTLCVSKKFIDTLFVESEKDENNKDLVNFLKNELHRVTLICDLSSRIDYASAIDDNPLWEVLIDKIETIKFRPNLENEVLGDEFYNKLSERNLFLLSNDELACSQLEGTRGYLYISANDIGEGWSRVRVLRNQSSFKVTNDKEFPADLKMDCWSKFSILSLPLTSIVIFDRYILGDKSNQKLQDNLFKLMLYLFKGKCSAKPLTLSIISEFELDAKIQEAYNKIMNFFKANSIDNVKLNIIRHSKGRYPTDFEGLHYRLILTNYVRIKCDDSFNFFKSNGSVNNDADVHISFNLSYPKSHFFDKEIKHLRRYVDFQKNYTTTQLLTDKLYYYQDKDNHLF